jgi:hypothetical protein
MLWKGNWIKKKGILHQFYCLFSREITHTLYGESTVKLSDDENEEDDDDNINNTNTVLTEITDNKINNNSINQNNSNDNHPPHSYENQM